MISIHAIAKVLLTTGAFSVALAAGPVKLDRGEGRIEIVIAGNPFGTYYFGTDTAKPYLMPLRTPSGVVVTRAFPVGNSVTGQDAAQRAFEPHQRPLFFCHGIVDGLDFLQEPVFDRYYTDHGHQAYGHMTFERPELAEESGDHAVVRARFSLRDPGERVIGEETQTYTFRSGNHANIVDCEFILHAVAGPLVMGDTKEGTFGIRLAPELSAPHGQMMNSSGALGEAAIWGKPADWVSYHGVVSGKPVGVAVFDSPDSFRHPTTWHARAYGLLAANPFGAREFTKDKNMDGSWTIAEGESLAFRYRVIVYDGELTREQLGELYRQYAAGK